MTVSNGMPDVNLTGAPYGAPWEDWATWISEMPVSIKLGLRCTEVAPGRVTMVHAGGEWLNATGTAVHGGAIVAPGGTDTGLRLGHGP